MIPVVTSLENDENLWPVARKALPKPFFSFLDESLMVKTLRRVSPLGSPMVLTTENMKPLTQQCLHQCQLPLDSGFYIPQKAPAIAGLCHQLKLQSKESEIVGLFPADHLIEDKDQLIQLCQEAQSLIQKTEVVILGFPPTGPLSEFPCMEIGESNKVLRFHKTLEDSFTKKKNLLWNVGIFFFQVQAMIENFKKLRPTLWEQIEFVGPAHSNSNAKKIYNQISPIGSGFDHEIIKSLPNLLCLKADMGWSDFGSWKKVFHTNSIKTRSQNIEVDAKNNHALSLTEKTIGFLGVENLTVVDTADALLICDNRPDSSHLNMEKLVHKVKSINPQLTEYHQWDTRPWGRYETLLHTNSEVVKKIWVNPGARFSYQSHDFREEHWVVVEGVGEVTLNDEIYPVQGGTYIHIPTQAKHRMTNKGPHPLCFIEVQRGPKLVESDIHRYQDDFGR